MAYSKHEWNAGEAITAPKMNTLETAVQDVAALADKLAADTGKDTGKESLQKQINDANSSITTVSTWIDGPGNRLRAEVEDSGGLMAQVAGLQTSTENGDAAWQQVAQVITRDSQGNVQTSLKKVVDDIKTDITAVNNTIGAGYSADNTISAAISTEITARRSNDDAIRELITNAATGHESFYGSEAPTTLQQRVADLMTGINRKANQSELSTATTAIGNQAQDIANIQSEINAAHRSANDTLDARLDDIEAAATTAAQDNDNTYVKKSQIQTSLDIETPGNVLDASLGKVLNDNITKINTALNGFIDTKTVQSEIDDTESALVKWVNNKIVDSTTINTVISPSDSTNITSAKVGKELYSELSNARISQAIRTPGQNEGDPDTDTTYNSLDERLEAIEGRANTASDAFEQLQTEILTARASNVKGTEDEETHEITPLEYGSLDARFEAAEGDIHKIASELKMYNQAGAIQDANTRIDTIEKNVLEMGKEIGMIDDLETVQTLSDTIDRASTYIDNIKSEIGAAHRTNEDTLNARFGAVESSVSNLNSTITNAETGLAKTKEIADEALGKANAAAVATEVTSALEGKASTQSVSDLSDRVTTLERAPKSATVVIDNSKITYTNGKPSSIGETPTEDKDYLLQGETPDTKYYYWKYLGIAPNGTWEQISGGDSEKGNGTSSGLIVNSLPNTEDADENTDYFVYDEATNAYLHYRFTTINNTKQEILIGVHPNNVVQYALSSSSDTETNKNYIDFYKFNYGADTAELDQGTRIAHIELVGGGGGTFSSKSISRITPRSQKQSITFEDKIYLRFFYTNGTANESDNYSLTHSNATTAEHIILGGGEETITSGDPQDASTTWPQSNPATGFYAFDVTNYCKTLGKQTFRLKITNPDDDNDYIVMKWEITLINLSVESSFPQTSINNLGESITFNYVPNGDIDKTVHFYLGETEIDTQDLTASQVDEQKFIIPAQTVEGAYQLRVYLTANNGNITSEPIYRDLIWKNSASDSIILSSPYRGRTTTVQQYSIVEIPYAIAGNSSSYIVKYYVDDLDNVYNEITLTNTSSGKWTYRPLTQGQQHLRIKVNDTYIDFTLNVEQNVVDIAPYTTNLILNFDPAGLSNNSEQARQWTNGTYHLTVSDNFDWFNGGYGADETGEYFLVKSGTRAYFDYKMFMQEQEQIETSGNQLVYVPTSKVYQTGQEMKIIFKTSAVRTIDAVWFTNTKKINNKDIGIQLSAHEGFLKTDTASDTAVGEGDEQVAATNTYLYFPYSEEDRIELDININKENSTSGAFTMSYEDGVPSKAYAYTHNQRLYHDLDDEAIITIGSDDCDVYIYKLRIYNNELTPAQVLRNFIADGKTVEESIQRYQRNCIYYDVEHDKYSPYLTSGFTLDAEALAPKIPSVKVLMMDAPTFTLNKKSFIKDTTLRCIHADGPEGIPYRSRGAADNWFFENGYHAGQGTTSDKYGDAGRNLDFLFNCDGSHKPSDKIKNPDPNYISKVTTGYGTTEAQTSVVSDWKGDSGKIALTSTSIPNNFFNFKVNIASSENVNNALLQKRYNDFLPYIYQSPAYLRDNKIKNDMEFVPAVLFVRENSTTEVHSEFNDTKWHFYALGNLGDSKKTDYTRAYDPDDMNEFTIEISDNNTNNSQFQTGVYLVNGTPTLETFEAVQDIDDEGELIDGSYTAQGRSGAIATTDYVFPLDTPELKAMWNAVDSQGNFLNKNHWSLVNELYDGDHSFEMRYACKGDYRDGKKVNDTTGQADAQLLKNSKVWQAFYSWVVTSSNEEFARDLDQWCVRNAVEFWYAFTHYYTMMDSRAKNTFWHFAKTGKYRKVTNPVEDLFHVYKVSENATLVPGTSNEWTGTFTKPSETFNASNTYYTEYAFDLWDYDNDTALGIDNNGELIFPYGKEDKDYRMGNDPDSGYVFNGAGSVFWRRLRDLCTSEISNVFHMATEQFFSAENLIQQFDEFQECFPEALWQLDIQRKYIRPFTGDTSDGSKTRQSKRFLESMMQGRKKYQRRQWIKDQYYYFGSKYKLNNITEDFFYLDCYTGPNDALIAELLQQGNTTEAAKYVGSNWDLTITPYQDMYINASFGETAKSPVRAKAGEPIEMTCPFTSMNNTRIYIYGASRLKALAGKPIKNNNNEIIGAEGLASLYIGVNSIERTDKLQHLYLGTEKTTYRNANLTKLTLNESSPILETLDIRNCGDIAGELKLGGCNNLKTLEAEGTSINLVTLPSSSQIETLHLPSSVTSLSLSAARKLNDFYIFNKTTQQIDYTNLRSLLIDDSDKNSNINWLNIAKQNLDNYNYLYLLNLDTTSIADINELSIFAKKKQELEASSTNSVVLSGTINVTGDWSTIEKQQYGAPSGVWPNLEFNTIAENEQIKCKVTYYHSGYWRNGTYIESAAITTKFITQGEVIPDIYEGKSGTELPSRDPTIESVFTFGAYDENSQYMIYTGWTKSANESTATPLGNLDGTGNSAANPLRVSIQDGDALNLYTYYYKEDHRYTVRWKLDNDVIATRANQYYGRGYDLEAPTVAQMRQNGKTLVKDFKFNSNGTVSYKIFDGWNKLPTNIRPTEAEAKTGYYDITAVWKEVTKTLNDSDINGVFYDTSNITAEQLLVLSHMNSVDRTGNALTIVPQKTFTYEMGYDSKVEGTTVFTNRRLIGTSENNNSIAPFAARTEDKGFTIAIDYQFGATTNSTYPEVLVGCYARDSATGSNITGFALYRGYEASRGGAGINVCYNISPNNNDSSKRVAVGDALHRNIIVLRHPKDTNTLHIYSARSADATTSLNTEIQFSTISFTSSLVFNSDAKICLGALRSDITTNDLYSSGEGNNTRVAQGSVYWLKYWDEDLGEGECRALAAWPHETMTAIITAQNSNATNESDKLGLFLHNLNCSNHMNVWQDRFVTGNYEVSTGWDFVDEEDEEKTSVMRNICIKRIFPGLPTELQTIINAPKIGYYRYNRTQGQDSGSSVVTLGEVYTDQGFVYPPSISSINYNDYARYAAESIIERTGANIESTSDITPYVWTGTAATRITAYEPASYTSDSITWNRITPSSKWLNIRFNEWPLLFTSQLRVFVIKSGSLNRTFYAAINNSSNSSGAAITIQQNDIVIDVTDDNNVQGVYMYINSTNQSAYAIQTKAQVDKFATGTSTGRVGGWISSVPYVTRSVTDQTGTYPNFIYIKIDGTEISPSNISDTQYIQGLQTIDFSFAI